MMPMDEARLQRLIPTYRRNSDEANGALRASYIETIVMEQMPGGRFQIAARTNGGDGSFISPIQQNLGAGQAMLETMRRLLGGEPLTDDDTEVAAPVQVDVLQATPRTLSQPEEDSDFMKA